VRIGIAYISMHIALAAYLVGRRVDSAVGVLPSAVASLVAIGTMRWQRFGQYSTSYQAHHTHAHIHLVGTQVLQTLLLTNKETRCALA
jgi:hypothetical protein